MLISKVISSFGSTCLRFFAHMSGHHIGRLIVSKVDTKGRTELLKMAGNQKKRWLQVDINLTAGKEFQVLFSLHSFFYKKLAIRNKYWTVRKKLRNFSIRSKKNK